VAQDVGPEFKPQYHKKKKWRLRTTEDGYPEKFTLCIKTVNGRSLRVTVKQKYPTFMHTKGQLLVIGVGQKTLNS
jgi:hypothetical protein